MDEVLKKSGLKITRGRRAIIKILTESGQPLDVDSLRKKLQALRISIDNATIYRILETFVVNNIVRQVEFKEGKFRYEIAALPHHHHAVCTQCGAIQDIAACDMHTLEKKVDKEFGFKTQAHTMEFYGLCADCQ